MAKLAIILAGLAGAAGAAAMAGGFLFVGPGGAGGAQGLVALFGKRPDLSQRTDLSRQALATEVLTRAAAGFVGDSRAAHPGGRLVFYGRPGLVEPGLCRVPAMVVGDGLVRGDPDSASEAAPRRPIDQELRTQDAFLLRPLMDDRAAAMADCERFRDFEHVAWTDSLGTARSLSALLRSLKSAARASFRGYGPPPVITCRQREVRDWGACDGAAILRNLDLTRVRSLNEMRDAPTTDGGLAYSASIDFSGKKDCETLSLRIRMTRPVIPQLVRRGPELTIAAPLATTVDVIRTGC